MHSGMRCAHLNNTLCFCLTITVNRNRSINWKLQLCEKMFLYGSVEVKFPQIVGEICDLSDS